MSTNHPNTPERIAAAYAFTLDALGVILDRPNILHFGTNWREHYGCPCPACAAVRATTHHCPACGFDGAPLVMPRGAAHTKPVCPACGAFDGEDRARASAATVLVRLRALVHELEATR